MSNSPILTPIKLTNQVQELRGADLGLEEELSDSGVFHFKYRQPINRHNYIGFSQKMYIAECCPLFRRQTKSARD